MSRSAEFTGELLGTFILVFLGCGSVALSVLFSAHLNPARDLAPSREEARPPTSLST